ncbi:DUF3813 domain-containing protein [Bacillus pumilus]|nr:DUF3813 domain-containing protein [Bacillus pumilus]OLP64782.1 hypothetical protein BACPU_21020 [Bacillus pumilus]
MRNELFDQAKSFTGEALTSSFSSGLERQKAVERAKNAVSSAFANSTDAERNQLHTFQDLLDDL